MNFKQGSSMSMIMLWTMLIMALGFWAYSIAAAMSRVRSIILERERDTTWVSKLPEFNRTAS